MGSKNAENKDDVAKHITAMATFDTLIASKKNSQCNPTIAPADKRGKIFLFFIVCIFFLSNRNINKHIKASNILYQTKSIVCSEINLPRIPVNPKITTIKCSEISLCLCIILYIN